MNFFIFSLPRSGSAWLSIFLTYGGSFCYHEPSAEREPLDKLFERPGSGAIDTLAYTHPERYKKYRLFVLARAADQIEESSRRCGVNYRAPIVEFNRVTYGLPQIEHCRLSDIDYLQQVWSMIVGTPFDRDRTEQLAGMNITRDLSKISSKVPALAHLLNQKECI
jgi:hypothetical protein